LSVALAWCHHPGRVVWGEGREGAREGGWEAAAVCSEWIQVGLGALCRSSVVLLGAYVGTLLDALNSSWCADARLQ
jgi:hypothetical protein